MLDKIRFLPQYLQILVVFSGTLKKVQVYWNVYMWCDTELSLLLE